MPIVDKLKNTIWDGRFKIKSKLSEGSFGQIYTGYDMTNKKEGKRCPIIIKFTQNHVMNDLEFDALVKVYKYAQNFNQGDVFAKTYVKGKAFI